MDCCSLPSSHGMYMRWPWLVRDRLGVCASTGAALVSLWLLLPLCQSRSAGRSYFCCACHPTTYDSSAYLTPRKSAIYVS